MSDQTDPGTGQGDTGTPGAEDPLTKLQNELQRVGAQEHGKGKTAGKVELLTELGFKSKEEAKAAITAWREGTTNASELEQKYQAAVAEAAAARSDAARWELTSTASAALVAAGVRGERADASLQLVLGAMAREPELPSADRIATIVTSFKEQTPEFFGAPSTPGAGQDPSFKPAVPGPAGFAGGNAPNGSRGGADPAQLGDAKFQELFGKQLAAAQRNTSST